MLDVVCSEICSLCHKTFTIVSRFIRHKCQSDCQSDYALVPRREHLIRNVKTELNTSQRCYRQTRKRSRKDSYSESGQLQKMVRTGHGTAVISNVNLQATPAIHSVGIDRQILYASEMSRLEDSAQWIPPPETTTLISASATEFSLYSDTDTGIIPMGSCSWPLIDDDDDGWAYALQATAGALEDDNGWAYAKHRWIHSNEMPS
jgi:hypothetical protein